MRPRDNSSTPFEQTMENLSAAILNATGAKEWGVVNELSRQLAELHRRDAGPPVRAVHAPVTNARSGGGAR